MLENLPDKKKASKTFDRSKLLKSLYRISNTLAIGVSIPSSARRSGLYWGALFPEYEQFSDLKRGSEKELWLDLGSGLTNINPYSFANELVRNENTQGVQLYGVEPRAPDKFTLRNLIHVHIDIFRDHLLSIIRHGEIRVGTPASLRVFSAKADQLPLKDNSVDRILSYCFLPYWLTDPDEMLRIFKEIKRVIKNEGDVRLFPLTESDLSLLCNQNTALGKYIDSTFNISVIRRAKVTYFPEETVLLSLVRLLTFNRLNNLLQKVLMEVLTVKLTPRQPLENYLSPEIFTHPA